MTTTPATFPADDLLPRSETNSLQFVNDLYDGSDVTIGILDTGIDPGIHALRYMKDGVTPKLIDVVDCSGSGDVDVSEEGSAVWTDCNGSDEACWTVVGLTGRTLKLCKDWNICHFPSCGTVDESLTKEDSKVDDATVTGDDGSKKTVTVRIGVKRAYELFPSSVTARIKLERKKLFDAEVDKYISAIHSKKSELEMKLSNQSSKITMEQGKERDDLNARLEVLTSKDWCTDDPGPIYDCVVFYDGSNYRAVIDVHETGDIRQSKPMTSFAKERQYATFGIVDQMNYAVNFYDNGKILSIICDTSPHGTHVASIAASGEPNRLGVAPGAKLVSLKIGDTRLGGMETGTSLTRALIEAIRHKCDIINLSYGEDAVLSNRGRFKELADELVLKHNIIFLSSAGNDGPAISTVNAPGGTMSCCIGIAAYVSPAMMKSMYCIPFTTTNQPTDDTKDAAGNEIPGTTYTWSSTGPTPDGDNGVSVTAPGAAITSVSNWCLQKSMLMNGTSMSCPNATGCVALLVSGCKAEGIPITSARVRRALENSALSIPGKSTLQQGWGMIQVDKAFEHLRTCKDIDDEDISFTVTIANRLGNPRGIYLRQKDETLIKKSFSVLVKPSFRREDHVSDLTQQEKIKFEMHVSLNSTEPWVTAPEHIFLMNQARDFKVEVDPSNLEPGVHTAKVNGYDSIKPERKVMFSVPITVVKPMPIQRVINLGTVAFSPAEVRRYFVVPPPGSTWMDISVIDLRDAVEENDASGKALVLHTVQLLPHASYRVLETHKTLSLSPTQTSVTSVAVEENHTIEVNLSRYWSTVGTTKISLSIAFRGIRPVPSRLDIVAGSFGAMTRITSDLADEIVDPRATLTKWQTPLRPTSAVVTPLGERDVFPSHDKEIYQLVLTYDFEQEEKGSFVPRAPALQGMLYESGYESQIMLFFDGDKKYLGVSDMKPSSITAPKGNVVIRVQVRHDDPTQLDKLKEMIVWIERCLPKEIELTAHDCKQDLIDGQNTFKKQLMVKGSCAVVFFSEPPQSKMPSKCKAGDILVGSMTFGSSSTSLPGENKRPGGFSVKYYVGPKAKEPPKEAEPIEPEDLRTTEEKMNEAVRDLKVEHLKKLTSEEREGGLFDELYAKSESEFPAYVPLRLAKLQYLDSHKKRSEMLTDIVGAAEGVLSCLSEDDIARTMGRNGNDEDPKDIRVSFDRT